MRFLREYSPKIAPPTIKSRRRSAAGSAPMDRKQQPQPIPALTRPSNSAGKTSEGRSRKDSSPRTAVKTVTTAAAHRSCKTAFSKPVTLRAACPTTPSAHTRLRRIRRTEARIRRRRMPQHGLTPRVHFTKWDVRGHVDGRKRPWEQHPAGIDPAAYSVCHCDLRTGRSGQARDRACHAGQGKRVDRRAALFGISALPKRDTKNADAARKTRRRLRFLC